MSDYSEDDGSDFYDYDSDEPVVEEVSASVIPGLSSEIDSHKWC